MRPAPAEGSERNQKMMTGIQKRGTRRPPPPGESRPERSMSFDKPEQASTVASAGLSVAETARATG
jgi:hypothetical protein